MIFCHLSHVPRLILACTFLKFHQNFHVLTHIYMWINDIHFKYIWAGRRDLIFTSVAHLHKKLKVVGVLEVRTWGGAGVSVLVCTRGAALEMDWWKLGGVSV